MVMVMDAAVRVLLRNSRSGRKRPPLGPGELRQMSILATRDNGAVRVKGALRPPGAGRRGAASHTARGLRALLTLRQGGALDHIP